MLERLRHFGSELKRRHVYRVAVAYVVVGLGVLGAAEVILDPLGLGGARPFVVVLTLLGFPLALVLAWAYEVRPDGPTDPAPFDSVAGESQSASDHDANSIVVLPFANLSPDSNNEYFADGITEEIINAVANISGLRVIARTSAFAFKGSNQDVREIGKELGVGTALEGSVRRAGNRLRITAQLIDVTGGHHLWSEQYDRDLDDVFAIQGEIAQIIARRLTPDAAALAKPERPTDNLEAYEAALRGRFYWAKGTPETYAKSVSYYEKATTLDPEYAQAFAGLAETLSYWGLLEDPTEHFPRAKAAAQRALEIDEGLADAYAMLGQIHFFFDWDWTGSIAAFERALELDPDSDRCLQWYAAVLANLGRTEEAVAHSRKSVQLDPLGAQVNQTLSWSLFQAGDFVESLEYSNKALELSPNYMLALITKGFALLELGRLDEAEETYESLLEVWPTEPLARAGLAQAYARMGRRDDALEQVKELERRPIGSGGQVAASAAWVHASLGNIDDAMNWIERSIEARESFIVCLPTFSWWDPLRDDPRFEAFLRQLHFPEWSYKQDA